MKKLTENETIKILIEHLKDNGWSIDSYCLGQQRGKDIVASNGETKMIVEAKGAKASDNSPTKKRNYFDSGQIKTHFGKALVKILDEKHSNPNSIFAIAHPDDPDIKTAIGHFPRFLKTLGVKQFWVSSNGKVTEE